MQARKDAAAALKQSTEAWKAVCSSIHILTIAALANARWGLTVQVLSSVGREDCAGEDARTTAGLETGATEECGLDGFEVVEESGQLLRQRRFKLEWLASQRLRKFKLCSVEKVAAELEALRFGLFAGGARAPGGGLLG